MIALRRGHQALRGGETRSERAARPADLPALGLDAWGFRIFRRSL
jgi:hypothetical protein